VVVLVIAGLIGTVFSFGLRGDRLLDPMYRDVIAMERKYEWLDMVDLSYTPSGNLIVALAIRKGHAAPSDSFLSAFYDAVALIDKHITDDAAGAFLWLYAYDDRGRMIAYYVYQGEGRDIRQEGANEETLPLIYKNMGPIAIVRINHAWRASPIYVADPARSPYAGREPLSDL
jgi:hypothetical protein